MTRPLRAMLAAATLLAAGAAAHAVSDQGDEGDTPAGGISVGAAALVIDDDLRTRVVRLVGLERGSMIVVDEDGRRIRAPLEKVLAVLPSASLPNADEGVGAVSPEARAGAISIGTLRSRLLAARSGWLERVDGMRYPGAFLGTAGDPELVAWEHPRFGIVEASIDQIARLSMPAEGSSGPWLDLDAAPVEDVLYLTNGDRLTGLVMGLGDPVEIESADGVVETARSNVEAVILANPAEPMSGVVVWLDDGTVTEVRSVTSPGGRTVELVLDSGQSAEYALDSLRAVGFDTGRLVPLSSLAPETEAAIGDRRVALGVVTRHHPDDVLTGSAATLGAMDLELPGPMRLVYRLPRGTMRFAATASLPEATAPWGDCELVVSVDGEESFRQRLSQDSAIASINIAAVGRQMEIRLEPGRYGPIRDRVRLHRPLILLAP